MPKPKIAKDKLMLLAQRFPKALDAAGIPRRTVSEWASKTDSEIAVDSLSFGKLGDALSRVSRGAWQTASPLQSSSEMTLHTFQEMLDGFSNNTFEPLDGNIRTEANPPTTSDLIQRYRDTWRTILDVATKQPRAANAPAQQVQFDQRYERLRSLRLDCYIWPEIQWTRGAPTMSGKEPDWETVAGEDSQVADRLIDKLGRERLVAMHDDAGMGKTAFSWKLFERIIRRDSGPSLVVRLEGAWPRKAANGATELGQPLSLMELLVRELLVDIDGELAVDPDNSGPPDTPTDRARIVIREIAQAGRLYLILDGLDQMTTQDRQAAIDAIELSVGGKDGVGVCHWLVSGRPFAFILDGTPEKLFGEGVLRIRLRRFDRGRQLRYFEDLAADPFFRGQEASRRHPIDYLCADWLARTVSNDNPNDSDLGIPLHLAEIRRVVEAARTDDGAGPINADRMATIHSSSDLHARVSYVYLKRALERTIVPPPSGDVSGACLSPAEQLTELRRVCGVLAMQMMLDANYNASIDKTTQDLPSYRGVKRGRLVETYLQRCRCRYEAALAGEPSYWDWAVAILREIELTHRGDIDLFSEECRSFRDRKAMEWYAAHYWMNHASTADWDQIIEGAGEERLLDIVGQAQWTRCWELAMELPAGLLSDIHGERAVEYVLKRPEPSLTRKRPCEWMYEAWRTRLEPDEAAKRAGIKPLTRAIGLIAEFRREFRNLCEIQKNPIALTLVHIPDRDAPDERLENPNQTPDGWYRRIPDIGESISFKGERPVEVTISQFWLRKFVVTDEEYRLFDPCHQSGHDNNEVPVTDVDWYMATMFCRWLGAHYRLPTEAEWEAACRANNPDIHGKYLESEYWFQGDASELSKHAWCYENSNSRPHSRSESEATGGHANRWGLYDMLGNVWEWCSDWYQHPYDAGCVLDPQGPSRGSARVFRGGSFADPADDCRPAYRSRGAPSSRDNFLGFRLALSFVGVPGKPGKEKR